MIRNFFLIFVIAVIMFFFSAGFAAASEGIIELRNVNGRGARCFAMSTYFNGSNNYKLLMQCSDLIYPIEQDGNYYILWATPIAENPTPERIGELGYGKQVFDYRKAFSDLFVTREQNRNSRQASSSKIMTGKVMPITFLNNQSTPIVTKAKLSPSPSAAKTTITPTPAATGRSTTSFATTVILIIVIITIFAIVIYAILRVRKAIT